MNKFAVDTNVLIYLHDEPGSIKTERSKDLVKSSPIVSSQVLSEYLNVLKRLLKVSKVRLIDHCLLLADACEIFNINQPILKKSKDLIIGYDFQLFDSIIVATALEANCDILYSEDL